MTLNLHPDGRREGLHQRSSSSAPSGINNMKKKPPQNHHREEEEEEAVNLGVVGARCEAEDEMDVSEDGCDACAACDDTCADPRCLACAGKRQRVGATRRRSYTLCEVRRHATAESCWLVAGSLIYDVTTFLPRHPAGTNSIVSHAGGGDCSEDLGFHSAKARRMWDNHRIGRLVPCASEKNGDDRCAIS